MINIQTLGSSSSGNCYLLKTSTGVLILESGIRFKVVKEALNFNLNNVAGCLITHEHGDHSKYFNEFLKYGVNVFASKKTREKLEPNPMDRQILGIEHNEQIQIRDFKVKALDVQHDVPCFAYMINHSDFGTLVFVTDTNDFPYNIKADYWLIEANYDESIMLNNIEAGKLNPVVANRSYKSHMSIDTCIDVLRRQDLSGCKKVFLCHLSGGNADRLQFVNNIQAAIGVPCNAVV